MSVMFVMSFMHVWYFDFDLFSYSAVSWQMLGLWNVCVNKTKTLKQNIKFCIYTGCFMTWGHYCSRWFPRS